MKKNDILIKTLALVLLYFFYAFYHTAYGQQVNRFASIVEIATDNIKTAPASPQKTLSEIARCLHEEEQSLSISYDKQKVKCSLEGSGRLFQVPGGESRAALLELPDYVNDYILNIKSKARRGAFNIFMFAPTGVFLDSAFRITHFLKERNFLFVNPKVFSAMHIETDVIIDSERKEDKYLLIYTTNSAERINTYCPDAKSFALLRYPVMSSPQGNIALELHLR